MLNIGWFRLWIVVVAAASFALSAFTANEIFWQDTCYRYVTISNKKGFVSDEDMQVIDHLREEAKSREYCGNTQYSILLTLEQLAKRGVVTQIGIQWREPRGWTFTNFDFLDILESKDITADTILERIQRYVFNARVRSFVRWGICLLVTSLCLLLVGFGFAWVRRGFQHKEE